MQISIQNSNQCFETKLWKINNILIFNEKTTPKSSNFLLFSKSIFYLLRFHLHLASPTYFATKAKYLYNFKREQSGYFTFQKKEKKTNLYEFEHIFFSNL